MQPLATTQLTMTWLSMCPPDESSNALRKRAYVVCTSIFLILNLTSIISSLFYIPKFFSIDFDGAVFAFMVVIGLCGVIYCSIAAISMCHQIGDIFSGLSTIYNAHKDAVAFQFLATANKISEWMWTIYFKYASVSIIGMVITSLLSVLYSYLIRGDLNAEHFYRPAKLVLPWNQTTYVGYFGEMCLSTPTTYSSLILMGTPLLLFISICLHHQAFYKMFKHSIDSTKKCDAKMLCDLIRFHIAANDWFSHSANVYRPFVLIQLICNAVIMIVSLFYIDLQWQHFDFIVATVLVTTSAGMSNLFLYCYFGKLAAESYEMMSDCVFNMEWYEQLNEMQKYFVLMIENMQKPVYYHGFGVAKLNLETFIKLCISVLKYYIAIKALSSSK